MTLIDEQPLPQAVHGFSVNGLTVKAAHHKIDEEIRLAEKRIRDLRTLRNSVVPISQLPNEVHSEVMMHAYRAGPNPPRIGLCLSWVSRHWRYIARRNPRLWSVIANQLDCDNSQVMGLRWTKECLARSKHALLHVDLQYPTTSVLEACLSNLPRMQTLTYAKMYNDGPIQCTKAKEGQPKNLWIEPAPNLASLELRCVRFTGSEGQFLGGQYPKLTQVSLTSCEFDWSTSPLWSASTITRLTISTPRQRIEAGQLAKKLESMPLLEHCSLKQCLPASGRRTILPHSVHLPSLRRLYFEDDLDSINKLLKFLEFPMESSIEVQVKADAVDTPITEEDVCKVFDAFKKLRPYLWDNLNSLVVNGQPFFVEASNTSTGASDVILFQSCHARLSNVPATSCRHLATTNLERLTIRQIKSQLYEVFGGLQSLKSITFGPLAEDDFISDLFDNSEGKKKREIPLPALEELNFEGQVSEDKLYRLLSKRKNTLKKKLVRLSLPRCSQEYFVKFKKVAEEVVVDEVDAPVPVPRVTRQKKR